MDRKENVGLLACSVVARCKKSSPCSAMYLASVSAAFCFAGGGGFGQFPISATSGFWLC